MRNSYALASGLLLALSCLAAAGSPARADEATASTPLGKQIANFELRDFGGKPYTLDALRDRQAVVVAFLGTECPLAKLYAPRLVQLADRFADSGVAFLAINANQQDSLSEMAAYAKSHKLNFPLLKDVGNVVADQMGAVRTPEVFLLDGDRKVCYRGRIDDQYVVGRQRDAATREDLALAIEELLAGKPVSQAVTEAPGCFIGRVYEPLEDAEVTYTGDVAAVLNRRCVECHRDGEIAPFALTSYDDVVGWAETIAEVIKDERMPPWHANPDYGTFSNDCRMSQEEKQLIYDWVAAGAPEGDPADLPKQPEFFAGWRLPRIDQEVFMSDEAFRVPAEGTVSYKYFWVDPGFTEDKWIQGAQCKAGNREVVHHIIVFVKPPPGGKRTGRGKGISRGFLAATAPGADPLLLEDGMAKFVPAGSQLVFQMHYTPNGSAQDDRSSIGLMFADPADVRKEVNTLAAQNHLLFIPPREPNYQTSAWHTFRRDTLLLSMFPHMHVRGKAFRYEVRYPDGTEEILLDVPRYDFNWQQTYELAEPKLLPKGTRMRCLAAYDNSTDNIANPNPDRIVHWGDQTWDEMLIGFMEVTDPDPTPRTAKTAATSDTSAAQ
ncbi:MAG: thiol-disulfide isomerase [Planctomycetota bacterium]|nr:MAG: thiol-disulfide isomerase [Planctomycetota bacterium]